MTASIRNVFTHPLTVQEQLREADAWTLRMALLKQEIAAALHKPVDAVSSDDVFDYNPADCVPGATCTLWLRDYRPIVRGITAGGAYPIAPFPDPTWPQESFDLVTQGEGQ